MLMNMSCVKKVRRNNEIIKAMAKQKTTAAQRRNYRTRNKIRRVNIDRECVREMRPRLSVFRSGKQIYAQVIDDLKGVTVAAASTLDKDLKEKLKSPAQTQKLQAEVGKLVAERAKKAGVEKVVFDRGRYIYHGRVKALAEGAREGGLSILKKRKKDLKIWHKHKKKKIKQNAKNQNSGTSGWYQPRCKVVKGGRRLVFAALMVVGDGKGRVGHGHGKAREVPEAIKKATEQAKRNMIRVPLREGRTLHHDVKGRHGAGKVFYALSTSRYWNYCRWSDARSFEALVFRMLLPKRLVQTTHIQW